MAEIKDGGPAYPTTGACYENMEPAGVGMSLRDYFAAKAMQATLSDNQNVVVLQRTSEKFGEEITSCLAKMSYAYADAMIRAREANHG